MLKREDIRIRDPFILTDTENGCYYMYGTTALVEGGYGTYPRYMVYKSYDLETFEEPRVIFDGEKHGFWADANFWAPEMHKYKDKYYLLGTCAKIGGRNMGTQIFVCDTPDGEFKPLSKYPVTPEEWACLDGTLWVENGVPYMVFCHEWTQVGNGEICAIRLSDDLSYAVSDPYVLFRASDNPCVTEVDRVGSGNYVTDGPFLFYEDGRLKMIWSSFSHGRYMVLEAASESNSLLGTWTHHGSRFDFDGGHAMLFHTLDGRRMISLHTPNVCPHERATFMPY